MDSAFCAARAAASGSAFCKLDWSLPPGLPDDLVVPPTACGAPGVVCLPAALLSASAHSNLLSLSTFIVVRPRANGAKGVLTMLFTAPNNPLFCWFFLCRSSLVIYFLRSSSRFHREFLLRRDAEHARREEQVAALVIAEN